MRSGRHSSSDRVEQTLSLVQDAHDQRMHSLADGDQERLHQASAYEREALYMHADAIRERSERLARSHR